MVGACRVEKEVYEPYLLDLLKVMNGVKGLCEEKEVDLIRVESDLGGLKKGLSQLPSRVEKAVEEAKNALGKTSEAKSFAKSCVKKFSQVFKEKKHEVEAVIRQAEVVLARREKELKHQKNWLKLGMPEEVIRISPSCVEFLVSSGAIFSMIGLSKGKENSLGFRIGQGKIDLLVEGAWMPWDEFQNRFSWSEEENHFVGKKDPKEHYLFLAPELGGFQKKDRYSESFPVQKLSEEEFKELKAHAAKYGEGQKPEEVESVLQVYTSPGSFGMTGWAEKLLSDPLSIPCHAALRLVSPQGEVYSFSFVMGRGEWPSSLGEAFKTLWGRAAMVDYDEFRKHRGRIITSIPLKKEKMKEILDWLQKTREDGGLPFNFATTNCANFAKEVLIKAGVKEVDTKATAGSVIAKALFGVCKKIPVIGPLLRTIENVVVKVFQWLRKITPSPIRKAVSFIVNVATYPLQLVLALFKVLIIAAMGGINKITPKALEMAKKHPEYKPFLRSWKEAILPGTPEVYTSSLLVDWQLKQKTTEIIPYDKPCLLIQSGKMGASKAKPNSFYTHSG